MTDLEFRIAVAEAAVSHKEDEYGQLLMALIVALEQLGGRIYITHDEMVEIVKSECRFMAEKDDGGVWVWVEVRGGT